MKSAFLESVFNMKEYVFPVEDEMYRKEMEIAENNNIDQVHIKEVIEMIKESGKYRLFVDSMNNVDENIIYASEGHGTGHIERVAVFSMAIGVLQKVSDEDLIVLLAASKYHDTGRVNDEDEAEHGRRSAEIIKKMGIGSNLQGEDQKILMAICTGHSRNDKESDSIMEEYGIKDKQRCTKLLAILKDADALDRVRLEEDRLDTSYLRTEEAKKMVLAAYELFYSYKKILREIEYSETNQNHKGILITTSDIAEVAQEAKTTTKYAAQKVEKIAKTKEKEEEIHGS